MQCSCCAKCASAATAARPTSATSRASSRRSTRPTPKKRKTSNHSFVLSFPPMAERTKLLHDCTVPKVTDFGQGYFELFLECPELAANLKAGQFVNVRVRDECFPLLRRPFSSFDWIADARGRASGISILGHVVGQGTALMAKMMPGSKVSLNGPLGKPFEPPEDKATRVILVGGG